MSSLFDDLPPDNGDPAEGEHRKHDAHGRFEGHRKHIVLRGRRALLSRLLDRGTATIDDVRNAVPLPAGINPKVFGAVLGPLAFGRIIRAVGSRKTGRAIGHARPVTVWEITDTAAAVAWLQNHPAPPPPDPTPAQ